MACPPRRRHATWGSSWLLRRRRRSPRDRNLRHDQQDALALQQLEMLEGRLDRGDPLRVEVPEVGQDQVEEGGRAADAGAIHGRINPGGLVLACRRLLDPAEGSARPQR